jgi:hypothetical protein
MLSFSAILLHMPPHPLLRNTENYFFKKKKKGEKCVTF